MRQIILLLCCITITYEVNAQKEKITIIGNIADSTTHQPLAFCNIQIFEETDSTKRLEATTTDIDGKFTIKKIKKQSAVMKITYIGYKTLSLKFDYTKVKNDTLNLDTLFLVSKSTDLGTLNIEAKVSRFEMDVDKLTMNIDEGLSGASENAFDLLKKTPGISIDYDENISLNGQNSVRFQFSGKDMKLDWNVIKAMLKSMSPEKIEKIEVISNPSAKYEADGSGGIINIVFDRKKNYGINGDVGASTAYDVVWNYSGDASINYMDDKWTFSAWGNYSWDNEKNLGGWSKSKKWQDGQDTLLFYSRTPEANEKNNGIYGNFYGDYTIDSNNLIGFSVSYHEYNSPISPSTSDTWISSSKDDYELIDSTCNIQNASSWMSKSLRGGLNYIHSFDTNDTKLSTDLDFSLDEQNSGSKEEYNYYDNASIWLRTKGQSSIEKRYNYDFKWKIDYQKKICKDGTIETGAKLSLSNSENNFDAKINNGSGYITDINRTNQFNYMENIYAVYISYSHKFGKKVNIRGGLRGEYTHTKGVQSVGNEEHPLDYPNLFPSVRISYMLNEKNRFTLGYNYRISRPWYSRLNPFIVKQSDYNETQGNFALKPSFNHTFSLSHNWNYCLNTSIHYTYTTDAIVDVPELKPNTMITLTKPQNLATAQSLGLYVSFNKNIGDKFHLYFSVGGNYSGSKYMNNNKLIPFNSLGMNSWANISYQLPWKINLSMFGYMYWNQGLSITKRSPWQNINLSINRSFFNNSLRLSLSAINLLSVKKSKSSYETPNTYYESEWNRAGIGFNFHVSYTFGKMYDKKKLTKIQSDDNNDRSK
ncbi:MAG: TonB-dependent receptor [Bacteroidales bacterium]|jgi:hypothetical protein|nr:TonB-dependent receptor [Bacteroidales bacterium]